RLLPPYPWHGSWALRVLQACSWAPCWEGWQMAGPVARCSAGGRRAAGFARRWAAVQGLEAGAARCPACLLLEPLADVGAHWRLPPVQVERLRVQGLLQREWTARLALAARSVGLAGLEGLERHTREPP